MAMEKQGRAGKALKPAELKKTSRLSVVLTDQMYERFKAVTMEEGETMNGVITKMIRKYIAEREA